MDGGGRSKERERTKEGRGNEGEGGRMVMMAEERGGDISFLLFFNVFYL